MYKLIPIITNNNYVLLVPQHVTVDDTEVLQAVLSLLVVSAAGLDGLHPQHIHAILTYQGAVFLSTVCIWSPDQLLFYNIVATECVDGSKMTQIFLSSLRFLAHDNIYAVAIARPSVRLTSVTWVDQSKTLKVRIMQLSPLSSPMTSFLVVNFSVKFQRERGH